MTIPTNLQTDELIISWDLPAPEWSATVELIDHFNARGMKRVYGRGDCFPNQCIYNMDIWKDKNNRLCMRFWSRGSDIDWESYEITGLKLDMERWSSKQFTLTEDLLPTEIRHEYENWVIAFMKFGTPTGLHRELGSSYASE